MLAILTKGIDRVQLLFVGGEFPIGVQLVAVEFGPGLREECRWSSQCMVIVIP
jgi:hypothetical protein